MATASPHSHSVVWMYNNPAAATIPAEHLLPGGSSWSLAPKEIRRSDPVDGYLAADAGGRLQVPERTALSLFPLILHTASATSVASDALKEIRFQQQPVGPLCFLPKISKKYYILLPQGLKRISLWIFIWFFHLFIFHWKYTSNLDIICIKTVKQLHFH